MKRISSVWIAAILLFFALHIATYSIAQANLSHHNVLVVDRILNKSWQKGSYQRIFRTGNRVFVRTFTGGVAVGVLGVISDSTITVKGKEIKLNDIKEINAYRGYEGVVIGTSLLATGIGIGETYTKYYNKQGDSYQGTFNMGIALVAVVIGFIGACTTVFGVTEIGTTKHFKIGKKWKLSVQHENDKPITDNAYLFPSHKKKPAPKN